MTRFNLLQNRLFLNTNLDGARAAARQLHRHRAAHRGADHAQPIGLRLPFGDGGQQPLQVVEHQGRPGEMLAGREIGAGVDRHLAPGAGEEGALRAGGYGGAARRSRT